MFDKFKERIAKLEETNETFRNAKAHVEKYQVVYACGGTAVVCIVGARIFMHPTMITNVIEAPAINNLPVFNNRPVIKIVNTVNNGGHCTKIVQRLSDMQIFEKAGDAAFEIAEKHDISLEYARQLLSKHLNGHTDHVFGESYKTIALGTTG